MLGIILSVMSICFCMFLLLERLGIVRIVQKKSFSDKFRDYEGFMQPSREEPAKKSRFGETR